MNPAARHAVVIGAGIVGAATTLELLRHGWQVTIVEPGEPGGTQAASYGNGAWLSPMSVIPPSTPGLWRRVPRFLLDKEGSLAIRMRYLPRVLPWLVRFLAAGWTERRVERIAASLRNLLLDSPKLHLALAAEAGVANLIEHRGALYVFPSRADFEREAMAWRIRKALGIEWVELSGDALRQHEPNLSRRYDFGVLVSEGGHCGNPGGYVNALVAQAQASGAVLRQDRANGFRLENGRLAAVLCENEAIPADAAVLCAGAWSKHLAASLGDAIPLDTERGYHVEVSDPEITPRLPLMPSDGKMGITLTQNGLRASGQVEIAGLNAAPDWNRAAILRDFLLSVFPGLPREIDPARVKMWMGHRPSLPDALPCIGRSTASPDVIYAFGHGHVGLAGGPRTARLVVQELAGRETDLDLRPFSPRRFARRQGRSEHPARRWCVDLRAT